MKKRALMYTLSPRQVPLENAWDVIVVAGGPAGCTAALAAAREGARTLLIEATGCLGGRGMHGLTPVWEPFSDQEKLIHRGLAQRILDVAKQGLAHIDPLALNGVPIDAERLKRVYVVPLAGTG
jgi:NADPH-dependent 2,4-dienoyl-CoA reductase/sulfur reductase-like enzyme